MRVKCTAVAVLIAATLMGTRGQPTPASETLNGQNGALVTTLAGSGAANVADGPAAQAGFLAPVALAVRRDGTILVADAAAQRVRAIDGSATVRTLAGSGLVDASGEHVPPGYVDGPAAVARFDQPSGLAVRSDGGIYIADRGNHCVRLLKNGIVSTFAGSASQSGSTNGTRALARFAAPMGLAVNGRGDLYVADFGNGVRKIDVAGNVSSVALPTGRGSDVTQVSYEGTDPGYLYASLASGVARLNIGDGSVQYYGSHSGEEDSDGAYPSHVTIAGRHAVGHPFGVAAIPHVGFAYSDPWSNSVRIAFQSTIRTLAGSEDENAAYDGGSFKDGPAADARFDAPTGLLRLGDGRILVADAGNRRIRAVSTPAYPQALWVDAMAAARDSYRIAFVGNSLVNYNSAPNDTLGVKLERDLTDSSPLRRPPKPLRVFTFPLIGSISAIAQFITEDVASGTADLVLWEINASEVISLNEVSRGNGRGVVLSKNPALWEPVVARDIREVAAACRAARIPLVVAINPSATEIAPTEALYGKLFFDDAQPFAAYEQEARLLREAIDRSGVDIIDLFPAFVAAERQPDRPALFSSIDYHYSDYGTLVAERELFRGLSRLEPWRSR